MFIRTDGAANDRLPAADEFARDTPIRNFLRRYFEDCKIKQVIDIVEARLDEFFTLEGNFQAFGIARRDMCVRGNLTQSSEPRLLWWEMVGGSIHIIDKRSKLYLCYSKLYLCYRVARLRNRHSKVVGNQRWYFENRVRLGESNPRFQRERPMS